MMSQRALAAEIVALGATLLWVYGGVALAVAAVGDGASVSFGAVAAVVMLPYLLARLLGGLNMSENAIRLWGVGVSLCLLYLILRVAVAGEPYVWKLGWLGDLFSEPGNTLEGEGGALTAVVLLAAAWVWSVIRGTRALTFDRVLAEVSVGLPVVLLAVAFAPAANAPAGLRWLPVPYMVAGLLALTLTHLRSVVPDRRRPFLGPWALWTGATLGAIALLALASSFFDPPSSETAADGVLLVARGAGLAVAFTLWPFVVAFAWVMEHAFDWLLGGQDLLPDEVDRSRPEERERDPARWSIVLGYVVQSGFVVLVAALALAVLWFAFRRLTRRSDDEEELREDVSREPGDLRSLLSGALRRLGRREGQGARGRDAIGRLYVSMLRGAAKQGLARPPSATPLEFAPRLEERFGSPVPGAISRSYAEARYAARPPQRAEVERLRSRWEEVLKNSP